MIVHLTTQGAQARWRNGRLVVEHQGQVLARIPANQVRMVVVWGNIGLTTPLLHALLARQVPVVLLSQRGRLRGRLVGPETPHAALRQAQYRARQDPAWVLATAQGLVAAKLQHQRTLLQRHRRRRATWLPDLERGLEGVQRALQALGRVTDLTGLRGVEGSGARAYFRGLRALFRPPCGFSGRRKRPPPDPVNALLSLGYTLLTQKARSAVEAVGLDPYVGFLHAETYGRPALALDLAEEFRPVVDGIVLRVCNQGLLKPREDFRDAEGGGVRLTEEGLRRFLAAFERRFAQRFRHPNGQRLSLNQSLVEQAQQLARRLRAGRAGYRGLGFR